MTDDAMPAWMVVDEDDDALDGCCVEDIQPERPVADNEIDDLVLTAGVDQANEAAKQARRDEYAALFPDAQ